MTETKLSKRFQLLEILEDEYGTEAIEMLVNHLSDEAVKKLLTLIEYANRDKA